MNEGWEGRDLIPAVSFCPVPLSRRPARSPFIPGHMMGARLLGGKWSLLCWSLSKPVVPCLPPWGEELLAGPPEGCWGAGALLPAQHQRPPALRAAKQAGGYFCLQTLSHFV